MNSDWMKDGACASGEYDKDLWFPDLGNAQASNKAKEICNTVCPVRDQCREHAITFPVALVGVWGGLSRREVRAERLKRGIRAQGEAEFSQLPRDWVPETT